MTHKANHKEFGEGMGGSMLDTSCEECCEKVVGGLDDKHFELLMGCTRKEFEGYCTLAYGHDQLLSGLYNFWDTIMGGNAMKAFARKADLDYRVRSKGHV